MERDDAVQVEDLRRPAKRLKVDDCDIESIAASMKHEDSRRVLLSVGEARLVEITLCPDMQEMVARAVEEKNAIVFFLLLRWTEKRLDNTVYSIYPTRNDAQSTIQGFFEACLVVVPSMSTPSMAHASS